MNHISPRNIAFQFRNLCVLAYANGHTQWHYRAGDATIADVQTPGYFADAVGMLLPGDLLTVSAWDGVAQLGVSAGPRLRNVFHGNIEIQQGQPEYAQ